ncbi:MAG: type II toxin-antitoxin system RelB/DinJ family antitoxin [Sulfurovum sp.]|nr:type II toxin-antitoxin system RelB/DinJ family antitoxin [Sulfurovum sp.]
MPKVQTSLRLEEETFNEAKKILSSLGMNFTEAVNIFASMVVQERGLPFDVKVSDYPSISFEEAQAKVHKSLEAMTESSGKDAQSFFKELLEK